MALHSTTALLHSWYRFLDTRKRGAHRHLIAEISKLDGMIEQLTTSLTNLEFTWKIYGTRGEANTNHMFQEFYQVLRALRVRKEQLEKMVSLCDSKQLRRAMRLRARPLRVAATGTTDPLPTCHYEIEADHMEHFLEMVLAAVSSELQGMKVFNATTTTHRSQGETLAIPASRKVSWA